MLGKLIKHEFSGSWRTLQWAYAAIGIISILLLLFWLAGVKLLAAFSAAGLLLAGITTVLMTLSVVTFRYYRNLYGNEGYLMMSLPVSRGSLVRAKFLVSYIWMVLCQITCFLTFYVFLHYLSKSFSLSPTSLVMQILPPDGMSITSIIFLAFCILINSAFLIALIQFSINLSNVSVFAKRNVTAAILIGLILGSILFILFLVFSLFIPLSIQMSAEGFTTSVSTLGSAILNGSGISDSLIGIGGTLFEALATMVLALLSSKIVKNWVSLK